MTSSGAQACLSIELGCAFGECDGVGNSQRLPYRTAPSHVESFTDISTHPPHSTSVASKPSVPTSARSTSRRATFSRPRLGVVGNSDDVIRLYPPKERVLALMRFTRTCRCATRPRAASCSRTLRTRTTTNPCSPRFPPTPIRTRSVLHCIHARPPPHTTPMTCQALSCFFRTAWRPCDWGLRAQLVEMQS